MISLCYFQEKSRIILTKHDDRLNKGYSSRDVVFDAALVGAPQHPEEATLAPISVEGVGDKPEGYATLRAPADDLDGVPADDLRRQVAIDT